MTPAELLIIVVSIVFGVFGTLWATCKFDLRRENFRKERIPAVAGLVLVLAGDFFYGVEWLAQGVHVGTAATYFLVTISFGLLGLLDDVVGDGSVRGFRGHLGALRQGKLTTGLGKMVGGGVVSLVAGFLLYYPLVWNALLAALVIVLTANTLNLLDLRPGRCLFGFLLGAAVVVGALACQHALNVGFLFYFAVAIALLLYPFDALGQVMLGDTGSNTFGALLGVGVALFCPTAMQVAAVVLMVVFQIWSEKKSLSKTIESSPLLRSLDRKIGVR